MARMPTFEEIREDFERGVRTAEQVIEHPFRRRDAAHETPAAQPVNLAATPVAATAPPQGDTMSLATFEDDLRAGVAGVKNEIGKFEQNLPAMVAEVRAVAGSPLGQLAVAAAQHLAAGVLPPEALAIVESGAAKLYSDILALYNPQGAQASAAPAAPAAPPAQ
jgi:hypothetical protein